MCQCISLSHLPTLFLSPCPSPSLSMQVPWALSVTFIVRLRLGICLMKLGTARRENLTLVIDPSGDWFERIVTWGISRPCQLDLYGCPQLRKRNLYKKRKICTYVFSQQQQLLPPWRAISLRNFADDILISHTRDMLADLFDLATIPRSFYQML